MTRGWQTSEGQMTAALLVVGAVLEGASAFLLALKDLRPEVAWIPVALAGVGAVLQVLTILGYQRARAVVKSGGSAALLLALGLTAGAPARAQLPGGFTVQAGPSLPLLVYQPGAEQALQVGAGAGVQVLISHPNFERDMAGGQRWTLLSLVGMAFGRVVSPASREDFWELALGGGVCTFSGLACAGLGAPVVYFGPARRGWFFWLGGGLNFEFGEEVTFAGGPTRANTVRIAW